MTHLEPVIVRYQLKIDFHIFIDEIQKKSEHKIAILQNNGNTLTTFLHLTDNRRWRIRKMQGFWEKVCGRR